MAKIADSDSNQSAHSEGSKGNIPEKEIRFIKQPYPISSMRGDMSLQQTHILVEMMDAIQDGIERLFQQQAPSGQQLLLFKEEDFDADGLVHIDVKFNKLANRPDAYRDVEKIAQGMMTMFIKDEHAEGDTAITLSHFVDSITYPKKGSKRDSIRFSFSRKQARQLFNFARYSKYVKAIARGARSQYTARLYMLITGNRKFGRWIVPYVELRRILGCDPYCEEKKQYGLKWDPKSKEYVDGRKYPLYKSFKMRILRTAEQELKDFADKGEVDCYFDFNEVYPVGSSSGDPEKIEFIIHTSHMGEIEDKRTQMSVKFHEMQEFMESNFDMSFNDCKQILQHVDESIYEQFFIRMKEIDESIRRQGDKINSRKKYAIRSLNEALNEFTPAVEEVKDRVEETKPVNEASQPRVLDVDKQQIRFSWISAVGQKYCFMYLNALPFDVIEKDGGKYIVFEYSHDEEREFVMKNKESMEKACGYRIM